MTKNKITAALIFMLLIVLIAGGAYLYFSHKAVVSRAIEKPIERITGPDKDDQSDFELLSRSIELASHLITIRYQTSVFTCLDKEYSRLPLGLWKGDARMCWTLEADVTAGFRTADLNVSLSEAGNFVIKAREPRILGVDNKSTRLIYLMAEEKFDWSERDIFPDLNARLKIEAKNLGILDDAKKSLEYLADSMSVKYGTNVEVKYISKK